MPNESRTVMEDSLRANKQKTKDPTAFDFSESVFLSSAPPQPTRGRLTAPGEGRRFFRLEDRENLSPSSATTNRIHSSEPFHAGPVRPLSFRSIGPRNARVTVWSSARRASSAVATETR